MPLPRVCGKNAVVSARHCGPWGIQERIGSQYGLLMAPIRPEAPIA